MDETPTLSRNLRSLPPTAWILFGGTFLNKFGSFVVPFLALYLTGRGFTFAQAGVAIGAYGLGNVFATIVGGHLADHIGRRKTIVLSMFSGAATMMMLSQATSYSAILITSALCGLTGEFYRPASSALLADLVPEANRVTAYSAYRMAINAGFAFGPATAGFLAGRGYFWLFAGDAATSALFGVVAFFALPEIPHPHENRSSWLEASRALLADRKLHRVLIAALGIALVFFQLNCTFGLAVTGAGLSLKEYGLLLSMNGAMVVFIELPLTTITTRHRPLSVIALGYLVIAIGFALTAFASTLAAFAACIAIFTFGEMASMPVTAAYVASLSPMHMRGRYMGAYGLTWTVAQVVGPGLGMALFSRSAPVYWAACGAIGIASAAFAARSSAISALPQPEPSPAGK